MTLKIKRMKNFVFLICHWKIKYNIKTEPQNLSAETFDLQSDVLFTQTIDPNNGTNLIFDNTVNFVIIPFTLIQIVSANDVKMKK